MKLSNIAKEPQLIEIKLDDEDTIKEFGEEVTFHTWDRQPMDIFTKMASLAEGNDLSGLLDIVRKLVLDEEGKEILVGENTLPTSMLMRVIQRVTESLGK